MNGEQKTVICCPATSGVFYDLLSSSKAETAYCSWHSSKSEASLPHLITPMLRRLPLWLLASAISVASLPGIAQEDGSADDLGV